MNVFDFLSSSERSDYTSLGSSEAKRIFLREFFCRDFRAFVFLLGYRDLGQFHLKEMESLSRFRFLSTHPVRRLWLWSRGFFKTSIITEAHSVWLIVNNPDIRILLVSFSLDVAKKPLGAIRNHFIGNEDFRYFFKEFCPKANKEGKIEFGTTEEFVIPNRNRQLKEPTVKCVGVGTNITGLHFDVMKIDDLVTKDSVTNDTQIQSSKDYYSLLKPIFDNPTIPREDVIGTIYHFNDLHCGLMENDEFEKSFKPAHDDLGNFTFPERLSRDGFEKLCNDPSMNPYDIQRQWLLRPVNPKDAKFKSEWWQTYDKLSEGVSEYICVDPASTQKKKSDYTVIEHWGVDSEGKHYLINGIRDRLTVFQRIDKIFFMAKSAKRLKSVKYEALGGRHGDLEALKEKFRSEKMYIEPEETKNTTSSKQDRIEQRLVGQFHAGMIYMPKTISYRSEFDGKVYDFVEEYKLEYLQFPFSEHDDILDCHSQMFDGSHIQKGEASKTAEHMDMFMWWRQKAIESKNPRFKRYVFGKKTINSRVIPSQTGWR
jgi:phage terminase large subunit-like protein